MCTDDIDAIHLLNRMLERGLLHHCRLNKLVENSDTAYYRFPQDHFKVHTTHGSAAEWCETRSTASSPSRLVQNFPLKLDGSSIHTYVQSVKQSRPIGTAAVDQLTHPHRPRLQYQTNKPCSFMGSARDWSEYLGPSNA